MQCRFLKKNYGAPGGKFGSIFLHHFRVPVFRSGTPSTLQGKGTACNLEKFLVVGQIR
jgi:hypothetical protein